MDGDNMCLYRCIPQNYKIFNCIEKQITFLTIFLAIGCRAVDGPGVNTA